MEPPFFRSYYQTPTPQPQRRASSHARSVPTQTTSSQPRKVVQIPVHFVESAQKRPNAALKIQKTFRGFRVRKTVKKILELKREVDGVERKLQERETMEVVKRDGMERLKISESLMSLLFRLDSVRGFNGEIRELRKKVIKKAIMLQELLDSVVVVGDDRKMSEERDSDEIVDDVENCGGIEENNGESLKDSCDDTSRMCVDDCEEKIDGEIMENSGLIDEFVNDNVMESLDNFGNMQVDDSAKNADICGEAKDSNETDGETLENTGTVEIGDETLEKTENVISEEPVQGEILDSGVEAWECVGEETEQQKSDFVEAAEGNDHGSAEDCRGERNSGKESSNDEWCVVGGGDKDRKRKENLLEKLAEDNQKLMTMVADLCQKNAVQTRVICSLSQRVEQLEKAMSERLRKKKKKCNNAVVHN